MRIDRAPLRPERVSQSKPSYAAMPKRKLTEEKHRQVIAALTVNSNATAVAKEIGGVSVGSIWKIAKKAGIELTAGIAARGSNNRKRPEKRAEIVAALTVNPNAAAVAGFRRGQRCWRLVDRSSRRHQGLRLPLSMARRRRGGPAVHHAFGAGMRAVGVANENLIKRSAGPVGTAAERREHNIRFCDPHHTHACPKGLRNRMVEEVK